MTVQDELEPFPIVGQLHIVLIDVGEVEGTLGEGGFNLDSNFSFEASIANCVKGGDRRVMRNLLS